MAPEFEEFWIDIGGTFTDCLAQDANGRLVRHKLLSSGIIKGTVGEGSQGDVIVDPLRKHEPADFWNGSRLTIFDSKGNSHGAAQVEQFFPDEGKLQLSNAIAFQPGNPYELDCNLEAPVLAIRYLLELKPDRPIPPVRLRLGTTRGTNALLTRSGAQTAMVTTRGFGDLLSIGYQERPRLFELAIQKSTPLAERSLEIDERVTAEGEVLFAPNRDVVRQQLEELKQQGIESLAICLLHADLYPEHERLVATIAAEVGFREISLSSEVAPLPRIVARAETTVVDAYLNPVLRDYLAGLKEKLPASQIRLMTSSGGLAADDAFRGHQSVLSGPAGGVVGYAEVAQAAGFKQAIGFDMGGTSTDVSRFDGQFQFDFESRKADVRLLTPTLAIDTVAAGGGSICSFDGTKLLVGPGSAGADPGPACYGRGGPLTVTDLNCSLGRIAEERFPFALDRAAVEDRLKEMADQVRQATGQALIPLELAEGLLRIANANMVRAVRGVTISQGADPGNYVLVAFGGAAGQHACSVARELEIRQVLVHPDSSILSAYGIGRADVVRHAVAGVAKLASEVSTEEMKNTFAQLATVPYREVRAENIPDSQMELHHSLDLRFEGTDTALNIAYREDSSFLKAFVESHRRQFGYVPENRAVEIVAARVEVVGKTRKAKRTSQRVERRAVIAERFADCVFDSQTTRAPWFDWSDLQPGASLSGPALIAEKRSTVVVEPGWQAELLSGGELLLTDHSKEQGGQPMVDGSPTAISLEIFNNLFAGIAEQMGYVLRRTALSVNVKERLDYSCALFTAKGELIANAPHVPVHLGAMGMSVRAVLQDNPQLAPGDVFVTNDPYRGGSHLPDITVVTPVHAPETGELLFFTACRAHHAEIGGTRPGSMPPNSTTLAEEGVLITNFALVRNGSSHEDALRKLLTETPYPSRRVEENLADIRAQLAANQQGANDLLELVRRYSLPVVRRQMAGIQQAAEKKVRSALSKFNQQHYKFVDYLETATGEEIPIQVDISFAEDPEAPAARIDFSGTGPVVAGNLNANPAIVTAAVLYVLRLLVDEEIPLNEGALRAVEILLPTCLLNPPAARAPAESPAVAAGNVETSQRVVDVLLGALGVAAASQGTMNNLLFGNKEFGYYETICGGSGATAEHDGADTVQVHMTNTRATDPEIFERRLPVRLLEFSVRHGSGGKGRHRGGAGAVRKLEFLAPLELSLITSRRGSSPPYGTQGGEAGSIGRNLLYRQGKNSQALPGICQLSVEPGDILEIHTPGGGGFGRPETPPE